MEMCLSLYREGPWDPFPPEMARPPNGSQSKPDMYEALGMDCRMKVLVYPVNYVHAANVTAIYRGLILLIVFCNFFIIDLYLGIRRINTVIMYELPFIYYSVVYY